MIDTDKYEGHTPAEEWGDIVYADGYLAILLDDDVYATDSDRRLMADAPLLVEEIKRLRDAIEETVHSWRDKPWGVMGDTIAIALWNAGDDILNILYGGDEE